MDGSFEPLPEQPAANPGYQPQNARQVPKHLRAWQLRIDRRQLAEIHAGVRAPQHLDRETYDFIRLYGTANDLEVVNRVLVDNPQLRLPVVTIDDTIKRSEPTRERQVVEPPNPRDILRGR